MVLLQKIPGRTLESAIKHARSLLSRFPFPPRVTSGDAILNVLELRQNVLPSGSEVGGGGEGLGFFFDEDLTVQLRRLFYLLSSARKANGRLPQLTFQLAWLQSAPTVTPQKKAWSVSNEGEIGRRLEGDAWGKEGDASSIIRRPPLLLNADLPGLVFANPADAFSHALHPKTFEVVAQREQNLRGE